MPYDIRFRNPFNLLISGASSSGKTTWVKNLLSLKPKLFTELPAKTFLFYKVMQDIYLEMEETGLVNELINVSENFPSLNEIQEMVHKYKDQGGSLLIFDDTMTDLHEDFEQIFCNISHHENASVIFLTQNLFYQNKVFRTMSLNCHYMVLMKNDRDKQQISILAKQFSPNNNAYITKAYAEATKKPYSYLLLDFKPEGPQNLRVRSNIFEFPCIAYIEK
jgi:uridine kinase